MVTQVGAQTGNVQAVQLVQKRYGVRNACIQEMDVRSNRRVRIQRKSCREWGSVRFTVTFPSLSKVAVTMPAIVSKGRGVDLS